jgi:NAD(P)-dependent dehydrogenase (short-subunit alcohol dehydrogenase family)
LAATERLADLGARLVLVGRSPERLDRLRLVLEATHGPDRATTVVADMSSLASVRAAVERIRSTEVRLDLVVDNAGAILDARRESPDGIEATLATMVVGPFALLAGLLPLLRTSGGGRVIAVTSGGMYTQSLHLEDLQWEREPFDGARAYARAKRAQVELVREWGRRLRGRSDAPRVNAMHPGWVDTPGLAASLPRFHRLMRPILRTPEEGADTVVWMAASEAIDPRGGRLYLDRRPRPFDRVPWTRTSRSERRDLWRTIVGLAEVTDPLPDR